MYLARYSLEDAEIAQALLVGRPAPHQIMREAKFCWQHLLKQCKKNGVDVFVRIVVFEGATSLILGAAQSVEQKHLVDQALADMAASTRTTFLRPDHAEEHDRYLSSGGTRAFLLKGGEYRLGNIALAADFSLDTHVGNLVQEAATRGATFYYQLSASPLADALEVERGARKHVIQLDFEPYVPSAVMLLQRNLAEKIGSCDFLIDEGFASDATLNEYLCALMEDECSIRMHELGLKELPYRDDDEAEDWFNTGLHASKLRRQELTYFMAAARDLVSARDLFGDAAGYLSSAPAQKNDLQHCIDVFISYSSKNGPETASICQGIEAAGIGCWIAPRDILPGESYPSAIVRGIRACTVFVIVFSASANLSPHVRREVERALSLGKYIIPIRLDDTALSNDMEYLISSCHWLDAIAPPLQKHIDRLVSTVRSFL